MATGIETEALTEPRRSLANIIISITKGTLPAIPNGPLAVSWNEIQGTDQYATDLLWARLVLGCNYLSRALLGDSEAFQISKGIYREVLDLCSDSIDPSENFGGDFNGVLAYSTFPGPHQTASLLFDLGTQLESQAGMARD